MCLLGNLRSSTIRCLLTSSVQFFCVLSFLIDLLAFKKYNLGRISVSGIFIVNIFFQSVPFLYSLSKTRGFTFDEDSFIFFLDGFTFCALAKKLPSAPRRCGIFFHSYKHFSFLLSL